MFLLGGDYPVKKTLTQRLREAQVTPRALIGVAGADTVLPNVVRNEGYLVSADGWAQLSQRAGLKIIPFEDRTFSWSLFMAYKKGSLPSDAAKAFMSYVLNWPGSFDFQTDCTL